MSLVEEAKEFAIKKHSDQTRKDGVTPYVTHCVSVANLAVEHSTTENKEEIDNILMASYLHDTIEDTNTTYEEIEIKFGGVVAALVLELTSDKSQYIKLGKSNYLKQKMLGMSDLALTIKLADRLHNLRDIKYVSIEKIKEFIVQNEEIVVYLEDNRELNPTQKKLINSLKEEILISKEYIETLQN